MIAIPEQFLDLFTSKVAFAHLATISADGGPQVTPVWFDLHDGKVRINTARGRAKDRNMGRDTRVALSILDPENPYRHFALRGRVSEVTEVGADAHIDALAKKYLNQDKYPFRREGEVRVIYVIEPTAVSGM
jgi:PPOX class probable F420-dependent enzyme